LADEMVRIYGIDVCELARRHERLNLTDEDWLRARARALRPARMDEHTWRYVVESAGSTPARGSSIVFANSFVRIYAVDTSGHSAVARSSGG